MRFTLTERAGPQVTRRTFDDGPAAVDALEARGRELARAAPREAVDLKVRRYEPGERVVARLELAGGRRLATGLRAGLDVRGDGSVQAYRGRVRRQVIEPRHGESAYGALRRLIGDR